MPTTTVAEIREMSDEQIVLTLKETCEDLFRLRMQAQTERLDAPSELRKSRRLIAKIKTVQRQREMDRYVTVTARFLHKSNNHPVTGTEYHARLFDKDVFVDDAMGEDHLDSAGRIKITCDLEDATRGDSFLALFEGQPDLYVILQRGSNELFRSRPVKYSRHTRRRRRLDLGIFKV